MMVEATKSYIWFGGPYEALNHPKSSSRNPCGPNWLLLLLLLRLLHLLLLLQLLLPRVVVPALVKEYLPSDSKVEFHPNLHFTTRRLTQCVQSVF